MKNKKGITLISLVITIVVLVILSAVAIYLTLGNNGILNKAEQAKNETIKQTATEKMNLKITNMQIEKYAEEQRMPTLQEFADGLCEDDEIQYVQLQSKKVGSLNKIEIGNASSIFTKLKEYPYEFEINSSLQLASIDGIQVATADTTKPKTKILFNGSKSSGTIEFAEDKIEDYDYYEFIFGIAKDDTSDARIFSQIVSKEYLQLELNTGGNRIISGSASFTAMVEMHISAVEENSITFVARALGTSWSNRTAYIYQIIGRNM